MDLQFPWIILRSYKSSRETFSRFTSNHYYLVRKLTTAQQQQTFYINTTTVGLGNISQYIYMYNILLNFAGNTNLWKS